MLENVLIKNSVFLIVLISGILYLMGLILTLIYPKIHIWPPPGENTWQFWFVNLLGSISVGGIPILGIIVWDSNWINYSLRFLLGGSMVILAFFFGLWSIKTLSINQSLGLKVKLIISGPYQYTRNPQYISYISLIIGLIIIINSTMVLITGLLAMFWFMIAPLAEEPWLLQQFGDEYQEYRKSVPRFVGIQSFEEIKNKQVFFKIQKQVGNFKKKKYSQK
ncbi:MAG: hypothetical protein HeimC3_48830 [Candidatus Heimdallarchaeota archaeon LC_3]|nr:MAG: hypothetical protein HeimC3_48830 [Candidatus Heimdallarchaeota archaeon LC_3]